MSARLQTREGLGHLTIMGKTTSRNQTTHALQARAAAGFAAFAGVIGLTCPLSLAQELEVQVQQTQQAQPQEHATPPDLEDPNAAGDEFDPMIDLAPGFAMTRAQDELVEEALFEFYKNLDQELWEKAFTDLLSLTNETRNAMAPLGDDGAYEPIHRSIQNRLRHLPADGRRAYRAFFDAQARELLNRCKDHPEPGSDAQLVMAIELYELHLMSSSGGEAANLLGDLFFERGQFQQAAACWSAILEFRIDSPVPELQLLVKQALALSRSPRQDVAEQTRAIAAHIHARFAGRSITLGGVTSDATTLLDSILSQQTNRRHPRNTRPIATGLPQSETPPVWQITFLDDATRATLSAVSNNNRGYGVPIDIMRLVPPTLADERAVYAHWMGVVFALDIETGKLLWRTGSFSDAGQGIGNRLNGIASNPRAYQIAQTKDLLFTLDTPIGHLESDRFVLTAYHKHSGEVAWSSQNISQWSDASFCGQLLIDGHNLYAVSHPVGGHELTLHRIDAATGEGDWSVPLGQALVQTVGWQQVAWMPQPALKRHAGEILVLTNNAALIAVDIARGELAWGHHLELPEGFENANQNFVQQSTNPLNAQGTGGLYIHGNTLYVKEARSRQLYAFDLTTHELLWQKSRQAYSEIVGVDEEFIYAMGDRVRAFQTQERHRLKWSFRPPNAPNFSSGLLTDRALFILTHRHLRMLDVQTGDELETFESPYLRSSGGRVLLENDLMICVSQRDITAFRVPIATPQPAE